MGLIQLFSSIQHLAFKLIFRDKYVKLIFELLVIGFSCVWCKLKVLYLQLLYLSHRLVVQSVNIELNVTRDMVLAAMLLCKFKSK